MKLHVHFFIQSKLILGFFLVSFSAFDAFASQSPMTQVNLPTITASNTSVSNFKSYREWKTNMIFEAESRVKTAKENLSKKRTAAGALSVDPNLAIKPNIKIGSEAGLNQNLEKIQDLLEKEQMQLSMAKDLTISDYFVGYLTKQKSLSTAIKEVSTRLSAEEVAELMMAYANNFFLTRPASSGATPRADSEL